MEMMTFRFAYGETRLETVLAAVGDKGLAALLLGNSRDRLHRELVRSFPQAELSEDAASLAEISVVHGSALVLWKALERFELFSVTVNQA